MFKAILANLMLALAVHSAPLKNYTCPKWEDIAQPGVKPGGDFSLINMTGDWYVLATSEPTLPPFCACAKETWSVTEYQPVMKYQWDFATKCLGLKFNIRMTGESRDLTQPGDLMENAAILGHRIMPLTPELIYDHVVLPDGNQVVFHYTCLDEPTRKLLRVKRPFGSYVIARRPSVSASTVRSMVEATAERTGGLMDIDGMKYADSTACGWDEKILV